VAPTAIAHRGNNAAPAAAGAAAKNAVKKISKEQREEADSRIGTALAIVIGSEPRPPRPPDTGEPFSDRAPAGRRSASSAGIRLATEGLPGLRSW
jgi:hypothetical protein